MNQLSPQELRDWMDQKKDFQLVDVREAHELEIATLGGLHIPMGDLLDRSAELRREIPVVLYCRSGARSMAIGLELENQSNLINLYNLTGGILAYAREIDPTIPLY